MYQTLSSYLLLTHKIINFFFTIHTLPHHNYNKIKKLCNSFFLNFLLQICSKKPLDMQQKLQNQAEWPKFVNELLGQDLKDRKASWAEIEMSPTGQGWTQVGDRASLALSFFFFLLILYIIFVVAPPSKTLGPSPTSNYRTQKLNKNNKNIHNGDCILAKNPFYH